MYWNVQASWKDFFFFAKLTMSYLVTMTPKSKHLIFPYLAVQASFSIPPCDGTTTQALKKQSEVSMLRLGACVCGRSAIEKKSFSRLLLNIVDSLCTVPCSTEGSYCGPFILSASKICPVSTYIKVNHCYNFRGKFITDQRKAAYEDMVNCWWYLICEQKTLLPPKMIKQTQ